MATEKQMTANRENGKKGGVKTPEGKVASRLNARKHGVFASALTEHDEEELHGVLAGLADWIKPVGAVEEMLVEKLALTYLRLQRCARAEAEYHIWTWEEEKGYQAEHRRQELLERGERVSNFKWKYFERAVELFGRYDIALTNQMVKLLHEIERLQRMRAGAPVLPPIVADLTVHGEQDGPGEPRPAPRNETSLPEEAAGER